MKILKGPLTRIEKIGIAGGGLFILGILLLHVVLPASTNAIVRRQLGLKKDWMMRDIWGKFPFTFDFHFTIFNVTNPEEIASGKKPILQEVGPYVYYEQQEKINQIDHEEDDTVSYTSRATYIFNPEKSNGLTGDEEVIVPNYFILALANVISVEMTWALVFLNNAVDALFKKPDSLFMKAKVRDLLFDGFIIDCRTDDLAAMGVCKEVKANYEKLRLKKVEENVYLISLWGQMNATESKSRMRVSRGLENIMDVGKVIEYNDKPNISIWKDDYCDSFDGTDGTVFHPFFDENGKDDMVVFSKEICRTVRLHHVSKSNYANIPLLRYTTDLGIDPKNNPLEACYCTRKEHCLPKGAYDLYNCLGVPLVLTNPHFLSADPYYLSMVKGLNPDEEKHKLIVDLKPLSGSPLHAHTRAQLNMFIKRIPEFKLMENFPDALIPLMWIDQEHNLPNFLVNRLKFGLTLLLIVKVLMHLMMFAGLGMCGYAGYQQYKLKQKLAVTPNDKIVKENPSVETTVDLKAIETPNMPTHIDSN